MTANASSRVPAPTPDQLRAAVGQFERANQVVATGNYDYGIRLYLSCCKLDPANLIYRQALRRTEKAKYNNNQRGHWLAWLTCWPTRARLKRLRMSGQHLQVLEVAEKILVSNPWDVGAQMDLTAAADALGLLDLAIWSAVQAQQNAQKDAHVNRTLARLYEQSGNFKQATALWEIVRKLDPKDGEAMRKVKDLAASETIQRGGYNDVVNSGNTGLPTPAARARSGSRDRGSSDKHPILNERLAREADQARTRLKDDAGNITSYLQLANAYRQAGQIEEAKKVLQEGLHPTGNAFELVAELTDLEIEVFRQNLGQTEEKLAKAPEDAELRRMRAQLRKEINTRELELFRKKADRFPTHMGYRFEIGLRLLRGGQSEEAIRELQAVRADPKYRWQALLYLGHCFKARNNWRLAQRNYEEALQSLPGNENAQRKELLFTLAQGLAENGELARAIDLGSELANEDYSFKEIGKLLEEWQAKQAKTNVPR